MDGLINGTNRKQFAALNQRRFDPLDSARSSMMVLGVFVHTALILPFFYPDRSYDDSLALAGIYQAIHIFRMPTFFFLAGIFGSALLFKSGYYGFIVSRFKRIVSVVLVAGAIIAAVLLPTGCTVCSAVGNTSYLDNGWLHLWFLVYLAIIAHVVLGVDWLLTRYLGDKYANAVIFILKRLTFNPLVIVVIALLTLLIPGYLGRDGALKMTFALIPDPSLLAVFTLFYVIGWICFYDMRQVFKNLEKYSWINIAIGSIAGIATGLLSTIGISFMFHAFVYTLGMWFITLGIVGIFIKYFPERTRFFGFLTDASYWVYLWHIIFVLLFAFAFKQVGFSLWLSFFWTSLISLLVTAFMYEWYVKDTLTDKWISGRRRRELSKRGL